MGEHLVAQAGIGPGAVVLDIGCGKGAVTLPAARAAGPGGQVTGIDLAVPMLDHARRAAEQAGLPMVTFGPGDAADPPFPDGRFDVVLAGNVVHFLTCPMTEVPGWGSLLTAGGTLAFSWNLAEDPHWVPVLAVFDTAMPSGMTGFAAMLRRRPFASVEQVQGLLAANAYQAVTTRVHTLALTYSSPQQWWAAARSQGPWAACWRHIPAWPPGRRAAGRVRAARQTARTRRFDSPDDAVRLHLRPQGHAMNVSMPRTPLKAVPLVVK